MAGRLGTVLGTLAAACALMFGLTACDPTSIITAKPESTTGRRFTIPGDYFGEQGEDAIEDGLAKIGAFDATRNADGSYTVTMSDTDYAAFVEDNLETTRQVLESICDSASYPSLSQVSMDDGLTNITFTATTDDCGPEAESAANLAIYYACLYQVLAGDPMVVTVRVQGPSGTLLGTWSYPEATPSQTSTAEATPSEATPTETSAAGAA